LTARPDGATLDPSIDHPAEGGMEERNRVRDPEHTRALVIDAAERLFAERGFAATSMRDISAASGVSHPLIHHHFGSKEDLYAAIKRRMVEGYARRFPKAARAANRPLSVRAEMRRIMTYLSENPVMLRLCGWRGISRSGPANPTSWTPSNTGSRPPRNEGECAGTSTRPP
jgi:AcrR family transcriptional regulator